MVYIFYKFNDIWVYFKIDSFLFDHLDNFRYALEAKEYV